MLFNYVLGIKDNDIKKLRINRREAVRAVIFKDDKILMVQTKKDDYKLPGGGTNKKESHDEALRREVQEETGYIISGVKEKLGVFVQRNLDKYEKNSIFEMVSHYYLCEVSSETTSQKLDDYEREQDFKPVWISVDSAIDRNQEILKRDDKDRNDWVYRETSVLMMLREQLSLVPAKS